MSDIAIPKLNNNDVAYTLVEWLVGAGEMRSTWRHERLRHIRGDRIVRHDLRPKNGDKDQKDDTGRSDCGQRVAAQDPGRVTKRRASHPIDTRGSAIP